MDIRLVRNATLVLQYADKRFLIDPFFAAKGTLPPFPNTPLPKGIKMYAQNERDAELIKKEGFLHVETF